MSTHRAAYIPVYGCSSVGIVLTAPEEATLSDAELLAAALPTLAYINRANRAIDAAEYDPADIQIGDWTE